MRDGNRSLGNVHRLGGTPGPLLKTDGVVSRGRALRVSAALSLLFLFVYGGCLWITAQRGDVGVYYFGWEKEIPFVPFMILPYLSMDLFFIGAPFLFRRASALRIFSFRVAGTILVAGVCFLLFPLRYAFPPPPLAGWLGTLFRCFLSLDAPYNLCPSLHAALLLLLVDAYARALRGLLRVAVMGWFVLIGLSPLLTHQHHVIDILAGFVLGGLCLALIRDNFTSPARGESGNQALP